MNLNSSSNKSFQSMPLTSLDNCLIDANWFPFALPPPAPPSEELPNSVPATIESPSFNWNVPFLPFTTRPPSGSIIASSTFSALSRSDAIEAAATAIPPAIAIAPTPNVIADIADIADIAADAIDIANGIAAIAAAAIIPFITWAFPTIEPNASIIDPNGPSIIEINVAFIPSKVCANLS